MKERKINKTCTFPISLLEELEQRAILNKSSLNSEIIYLLQLALKL